MNALSRRFPPMTMARTAMLAVLLPAMLSACGDAEERGDQLNALDKKLAATPADLRESIVVDPAVASGAKPARAEGKASAAQTPVPDMKAAPAALTAPAPRRWDDADCAGCGGMTLGEKAALQQAGRGQGDCQAELTHGPGWAKRLPPEFPVYPAGRVEEAAGADGGACTMRVVSFTSVAPVKKIVDYYYARAKKAGYSAEYVLNDGQHMLGGTRGRDKGAYVVMLTPKQGGGSMVDIVANTGR